MKYKNPWFKNERTSFSPEYFKLSENTRSIVEYRGFSVYRRLRDCWDWVLDGCCVSQRAGFSVEQFKKQVDSTIDNTILDHAGNQLNVDLMKKVILNNKLNTSEV
tara:strand:+ start:65 stop:379 length:315 start_codon:yes stop_codon:yes gene_type:complete